MSRETIVFLPGMMCDERLFAPQVEALKADYEIIIPQLTAPSIDEMAREVLLFVSAEAFNVVGLSMGGIVAMAIAAIAPQRLSRMALLDTNHLADAPEKFSVRNRQITDVENGKLRDVIIEEMKPAYLAEKNRGDQQLLDILIDMAIGIGAETFIAQTIALRDRAAQTNALKSFSGPSLVLCGEEDNLCSPERHIEIANLLAESNLVTIPKTGHISTLESPEKVNLALKRWLSS